MIQVMKGLMQLAANRLGYRVVRANGGPSVEDRWARGLDTFFESLRSFGFCPQHIVDVGANRGNWTRRALQFYPRARYTMVEPQECLKQYSADLLQRSAAIKWISAGVADKPGNLSLRVAEPDSTSTFYDDGKGGEGRVFVPVMMLNEIAASQGTPEMVKIDAEGFDLRVLIGASELLGRTDVFLVEVTVCGSIYENTLARVVRFMDENGYKVVDITDLNRSPKHGVLWLCELAFVRNGSGLFEVGPEYI